MQQPRAILTITLTNTREGRGGEGRGKGNAMQLRDRTLNVTCIPADVAVMEALVSNIPAAAAEFREGS